MTPLSVRVLPASGAGIPSAFSAAATRHAGIAGSTLRLHYLANQNGSAQITVRATDLAGASVETSFQVHVTAVNDAPTVANLISNVAVNEDAADTLLDLSTTFADVDILTNADSLTLAVVWFVAMLCPCGCKQVLQVSLTPSRGGG